MHSDYLELEKQQRINKEYETKKFSNQKLFLEQRQEIATAKESLLRNITEMKDKIEILHNNLDHVTTNKLKTDDE